MTAASENQARAKLPQQCVPVGGFLGTAKELRQLTNDLKNQLVDRYNSPHFYKVDSPIEGIKDLSALELDA